MLHDDVLCHPTVNFLKDVSQSVINKEISESAGRSLMFVSLAAKMIIQDKNIPCFYFDHNDFDKDENLSDTGKEFFKEGVMDIPYERCLYKLKNFVQHPCGRTTDGFILMCNLNDYYREEITNIGNECRINAPLGFLSDINIAFIEFNVVNNEIMICPYIGTVNHKSEKNAGALIPEGHNNMSQSLLSKSRACCGTLSAATMLLNTKYSEKENIIISEKLNKRRIKNGKEKFSNYTIVKLKRSNYDVSGALKSHASPKPHWRRGHVRKYQNGKISPISPCLVNWDGEEVKHKIYKVEDAA